MKRPGLYTAPHRPSDRFCSLSSPKGAGTITGTWLQCLFAAHRPLHASDRCAAVGVLEAHDVVLAEVTARLHLDDLERHLARVGEAVCVAERDVGPRRLSVGLEQTRLAMLLAVMHRHAGIVCFDQDVFVNAVGGVKITEPAADLAILFAIVSSLRDRPLKRGLAVFGEVGLAGEIRPAPRGQERLKEAAKLGFDTAIVPRANAPKHAIEGLKVIAVERVEEALEQLRELG